MKNVAKVFRERVKERGMTVKGVAERAGISPGALSAMLNERKRIMAMDFISLCRVLDLTPDDFN